MAEGVGKTLETAYDAKFCALATGGALQNLGLFRGRTSCLAVLYSYENKCHYRKRLASYEECFDNVW